MHASGSHIKTILEQIRFLVSTPTTDRFNDEYLTRYALYPAYAQCLGQLSLSRDDYLCLRFDITLEDGTERYLLPPIVEEVVDLAKLDTDGHYEKWFDPRSEKHSRGPGWKIEGNTIVFRPFPTSAEEWSVWYVPSQDATCHFAVDGVVTVGGNSLKVTLSANPELGMLDRRENSYVGLYLRILHNGIAFQDRLITAFDVTNLEATVAIAFSELPADGDPVTYEIVPEGLRKLADMVAGRAALRVAVAQNLQQKKMRFLEVEYSRAKKAITDTLSNRNARYAKSMDTDTRDADGRRPGVSWLG